MRPAPISSVSASATSPATRSLRVRSPPPRGDEARLPLFSASCGAVRPERERRRQPKSHGDQDARAKNRREHPSVDGRLRQSRESRVDRFGGSPPHPDVRAAVRPRFRARRARGSRPAIVQAHAHRPAPIDMRTAISLRLTDARARRRLATLAQAMRSTNPTAPRSTTSAHRARPISCSCSGARRSGW